MSEEQELGEKPEVEEPEPGSGDEVIVEPPEKPEEEEPKGPIPYERFQEVVAAKNEAIEERNQFRSLAMEMSEGMRGIREERVAQPPARPQPEERPLFGEEEIPEEEMSPRVRQIFKQQHGALQALEARMEAQQEEAHRFRGDVYRDGYDAAADRLEGKLKVSIDRDALFQYCERYGIPPSDIEDAFAMASYKRDAVVKRLMPAPTKHTEIASKGGPKGGPKRISKADFEALTPAEQYAQMEAEFNAGMRELRGE